MMTNEEDGGLEIPAPVEKTSDDQLDLLMNFMLDKFLGYESADNTAIGTYEQLQVMVRQCDDDIKNIENRRAVLGRLSRSILDKLTSHDKICVGLRRMDREDRRISGVGDGCKRIM